MFLAAWNKTKQVFSFQNLLNITHTAFPCLLPCGPLAHSLPAGHRGTLGGSSRSNVCTGTTYLIVWGLARFIQFNYVGTAPVNIMGFLRLLFAIDEEIKYHCSFASGFYRSDHNFNVARCPSSDQFHRIKSPTPSILAAWTAWHSTCWGP